MRLKLLATAMVLILGTAMVQGCAQSGGDDMINNTMEENRHVNVDHWW